MFANIVLVASALATIVGAQTTATPTTTYMPATATEGFNAANVSDSTKQTWCTSEYAVCRQACAGTLSGSASINSCDVTSLTASCVCKNGTAVDLTAFMESLPFYICQATFGQCQNAHPDDAAGKQACKDAEVCGYRNATAEEAAAPSSSAATTSGASSTSGSSAGTAATNTSTSTHNAAVMNAQVGTGAFVAMLMAVAKLAL